MVCHLCFVKKKELLQIFEGEYIGNEHEAGVANANIIIQHLPFLKFKADDPISKTVCIDCWRQVDVFHSFYLAIDKAQINFKLSRITPKKDPLRFTVKTEKDITSSLLDLDENEFANNLLKIEVGSNLCYKNIEPIEADENLNLEQAGAPRELLEDDNCIESGENRKKKPKPKPSKRLEKFNDCYDKVKKLMTLECGICGEEIENFPLLHKHAKTFHKKKGFVKCCSRQFNTIKLLADHAELHFNPDAFKCKVCQRRLKSRVILENHMAEHESDELKLFKCETCQKKFLKQHLLDTHVKFRHPKIEDGNGYHCDKCSLVYKTKSRLAIHLKSVHLDPKIVCHLCSKVFKNHTGFSYHLQLEHDEHGKHRQQCPECGIWLRHKYILQRHLRYKHRKDELEFPCKMCNEKFKTYLQRRHHIEEKHIPPKMFECTCCDRKFKRKTKLKEHFAWHAGAVIHKCEYCPRTFVNSGNKSKHVKTIHSKEYEENKRGTLSYLLSDAKNKKTQYYDMTGGNSAPYAAKSPPLIS